MAETKQANESGARRGRSPSFPFIPLETAVSRLGELVEKFGRHAIPVQKAGIAWKMKEGSSQASQTLAALKSYGFLKYEGSGNERKAHLTDEARTYLRAQQEHIKQDILRKAALKPKEIAKYWSEWRADPPIDEIRLDELILSAHYTDEGAKTFLKVYDDTIAYAGLSSSDKIIATGDSDDDEEGSADEQEPAKIGDLVQWVSQGAQQFKQPKRVRAVSQDEQWVFVEGEETGLQMSQIEIVEKGTTKAPVGGASGMEPPILPLGTEWREERLIDDQGQEILIRYKGDATSERYTFIRDYLDFKIKRLKPK